MPTQPPSPPPVRPKIGRPPSAWREAAQIGEAAAAPALVRTPRLRHWDLKFAVLILGVVVFTHMIAHHALRSDAAFIRRATEQEAGRSEASVTPSPEPPRRWIFSSRELP